MKQQGTGILPTPVIGGVGVINDCEKSMDMAFKGANEYIFVIGHDTDVMGHMGQSLYAREVLGKKGNDAGEPPLVDLNQEKQVGLFILKLINDGVLSSCHDVSDGGVLCAIAEMCLASNIGADLDVIDDTCFWFGEDQGRYIISTDNKDNVITLAEAENISIKQLGFTTGSSLSIGKDASISVEDLKQFHEDWLPDYMNIKKEV